MSIIIKGGETNGIYFSCMYDPHGNANRLKNENGVELKGVYGIAHNLNDAPSILWFDNDMNFVEGELLHNCINCTYCGKSGGGFFRECLYSGFQINDATDEWCENIKLISTISENYENVKIVKVTEFGSNPETDKVHYGVVLKSFSKDECKSLGMWGQLIQYIRFDNKKADETTYGWEIVENPDNELLKKGKLLLTSCKTEIISKDV